MDVIAQIKARIRVAEQAIGDKSFKPGDGLRRACALAVKQELENLLRSLEKQ